VGYAIRVLSVTDKNTGQYRKRLKEVAKTMGAPYWRQCTLPTARNAPDVPPTTTVLYLFGLYGQPRMDCSGFVVAPSAVATDATDATAATDATVVPPEVLQEVVSVEFQLPRPHDALLSTSFTKHQYVTVLLGATDGAKMEVERMDCGCCDAVVENRSMFHAVRQMVSGVVAPPSH
jgi:hypothetical protein